MDKLNISLSDMSDEDKNILFAIIKKYSQNESDGRCKPQAGEKYYYIASGGNVCVTTWRNNIYDKRRFDVKNCFEAKEEAANETEKLKIFTELKSFADENNESQIDWANIKQRKYVICLNKNNNEIIYSRVTTFCFCSNLAYFTSENVAKAAVKHVGAEKILKHVFGVKTDEKEWFYANCRWSDYIIR